MDKLPRKEDLLGQQLTPIRESLTGESSDVKKAKDDTDIATQVYKKMELEINTKLLQSGYKSLEEAQADLKRKHAEVDNSLQQISDERQFLTNEREEIEDEKQKILNAYAKVKQTEEMVRVRLEEAITIEKTRQSEATNHNALRGQLLYLIDYHSANIRPCRKALLNVSRSIYNFADSLNNAKVDYSNLYNYIGRVMKYIDEYVEKEGKSVPKTLLPEENHQPSDISKSAEIQLD